jgi:hypothetical protein
MATTKETDKIRSGFAKLSNMDAKKVTPPVIQEVAKPAVAKKIGRKKHTLEGVAYERIGVKVPADLKSGMVVAMATTHKDIKTMDLFVAEAIKAYLLIKR